MSFYDGTCHTEFLFFAFSISFYLSLSLSHIPLSLSRALIFLPHNHQTLTNISTWLYLLFVWFKKYARIYRNSFFILTKEHKPKTTQSSITIFTVQIVSFWTQFHCAKAITYVCMIFFARKDLGSYLSWFFSLQQKIWNARTWMHSSPPEYLFIFIVFLFAAS